MMFLGEIWEIGKKFCINMQFYGLKMQENYKKLGCFTTSSCKKYKIQYKVVEKIRGKNLRKNF